MSLCKCQSCWPTVRTEYGSQLAVLGVHSGIPYLQYLCRPSVCVWIIPYLDCDQAEDRRPFRGERTGIHRAVPLEVCALSLQSGTTEGWRLWAWSVWHHSTGWPLAQPYWGLKCNHWLIRCLNIVLVDLYFNGFSVYQNYQILNEFLFKYLNWF